MVVFVMVFRRYVPEMRLGLLALLLLIAALLLMAYSLTSMYPFPLSRRLEVAPAGRAQYARQASTYADANREGDPSLRSG